MGHRENQLLGDSRGFMIFQVLLTMALSSIVITSVFQMMDLQSKSSQTSQSQLDWSQSINNLSIVLDKSITCNKSGIVGLELDPTNSADIDPQTLKTPLGTPLFPKGNLKLSLKLTALDSGTCTNGEQKEYLGELNLELKKEGLFGAPSLHHLALLQISATCLGNGHIELTQCQSSAGGSDESESEVKIVNEQFRFMSRQAYCDSDDEWVRSQIVDEENHSMVIYPEPDKASNNAGQNFHFSSCYLFPDNPTVYGNCHDIHTTSAFEQMDYMFTNILHGNDVLYFVDNNSSNRGIFPYLYKSPLFGSEKTYWWDPSYPLVPNKQFKFKADTLPLEKYILNKHFFGSKNAGAVLKMQITKTQTLTSPAELTIVKGPCTGGEQMIDILYDVKAVLAAPSTNE